MHTYSRSSAPAPAGRNRRQALLARLIQAGRYSSQAELTAALRRGGLVVTQATLSRDLKNLGVGKVHGPDGRAVYVLPAPAAESLDRDRRSLDLRTFINETRVARNLVVVRTPAGHANAVGRAVDLLGYQELIGTVAGDDTLLAILTTDAGARRFKRYLDGLSTSPVRTK